MWNKVVFVKTICYTLHYFRMYECWALLETSSNYFPNLFLKLFRKLCLKIIVKKTGLGIVIDLWTIYYPIGGNGLMEHLIKCLLIWLSSSTLFVKS